MYKKIGSILKNAALSIFAVIVIFPFVIMILNSVKPGNEIFNAPLSLPSHIVWDGYIGVFTTLNIVRLLINSVFISGAGTILNIVFCLMVSYAIVKCDIPGRKIWLNIILASMMLPSVLLLIPQYEMFSSWGWINSYHVMIWPVALSAYNIFLMVQSLRSVNDEYLEAARIDGCNELYILVKIIPHLCMPAITTVGILTFMGAWNDFMRPLLYLRDQEKMTVQLAIYQFQSIIPNGQTQQLWAATTLVSIPVVIVFLCIQKNFIKAFTGVGLK